MIDIHLVSWNRPKMTELVIKTIHRNTNRDDFRLVVLDNGSEKSTQEMLYQLHENEYIDILIRWKKNYGLEKARQEMLLYATESEYFVCVDNDCLPPRNWLPEQLDLMRQYEDYAAISQRTPVMIGTGNIFEEADETGVPIVDFPHPGGSFRMMITRAVKDVGGWDRASTGRGSEEKYICGKLRDAGYGTAFSTHIRCLHLFGDRNKTQERWGYENGMKPEDSGHSDVWHPALAKGDEFEDVAYYAGEELAVRYFS